MRNIETETQKTNMKKKEIREKLFFLLGQKGLGKTEIIMGGAKRRDSPYV